METPTPKGAGVEAVLSRMARVSRKWPWVSRWGGASVGTSLRVSRVVKLVMELHHVSQGGKQGEFWDGGASVWASPCEFRWQPREVPKWWSKCVGFILGVPKW